MEIITLTREQYREDLRALLREELAARAEDRPAIPPGPEPEWLTTAQAAKYINRSTRYLREKAAEKGSPLQRRRGAGSKPDEYSRASLDAFLERLHA